MRNIVFGGLLATISLMTFASGFSQAQGIDSRGLPGRASPDYFPTPLGNPGEKGFFTFAEMSYLAQTWTMGDQLVAWRGLVDSSGRITGLPGTYIGSGAKALSTGELGRRSYQPAFRVGIGYSVPDMFTVTASYMQTARQTYNRSASLASPFFRGRPDQADTFLTSGVFNFPPQFAGPLNKTSLDGLVTPAVVIGGVTIIPQQSLPLGNFYGIWNGASTMTIELQQQYTNADIGVRVPLFETEYSRVYALAGGRFDWFFDRFRWRATSVDVFGNTRPQDSVEYTNTLSQRLYGPYIGCGHEIYLGKNFALSTDVNGAMLVGMIKERAKYKLDTGDIQNKRSLNDLALVPSAGGNINLWWYPTAGIQMRIGYQAQTFFNTKNLQQPIGFDYGAIDPVYGNQAFRMIHGLNVGIGFFF